MVCTHLHNYKVYTYIDSSLPNKMTNKYYSVQNRNGLKGLQQFRTPTSSSTSLKFSISLIQDGSGLQFPTAYEPEPLAKYGTLDVAFEYDSSEQWLAVTVTAATDIPALKQTGNISWQVHLVLLPTKKQRAKTGVQKGPCPVFTETFKFSRVEQEALGDYAVRFRLYSIRRMKKEKVLGEKVFYLTKLNLQGKIALPVTLEPGSELTVRTFCKCIYLQNVHIFV